MSNARTYRLSPPDRTGWMFGLGLIQLMICTAGVFCGVMVMSMVGTVPGLLVIVFGLGAGFAKIGDMTIVDAVPHVLRFTKTTVTGGIAWYSVVPLLDGDPDSDAPPALTDHEVLIVDAAHVGLAASGVKVAISRDNKTNSYSATLRVAGRQFALVDRGEQDHLVGQWGTALQSFIAERSPVVSIRWSEWAAPSGLDEHRRWVAEQMSADPLVDVKQAYEQLLVEAGSQATRHETLVTVTINAGKVSSRKAGRGKAGEDPVRAAVDVLLTEMRLFTQRLEGADLTVSLPLSPAEWSRAMRLRLDPSSRAALDGRTRSLGEAAGACAPDNAAPLAAKSNWTSWQTDGAWHRALYVSDWPRLDVPAAWMQDLMLYNGAVRTVSVFFEPIPRSKSQRQITRDAAKISGDAEHRAEKGFRVGAHHRRAARAVEEREEELVAGYGEFSYAGVVTVTAGSEAELDDATDEVTQVAASVGLELRPLHGRHDKAVCATLPIARGLVPKDHM